MRWGPVCEGPEFWPGNLYLGNLKDFEVRKHLNKIIGTVSGVTTWVTVHQQILNTCNTPGSIYLFPLHLHGPSRAGTVCHSLLCPQHRVWYRAGTQTHALSELEDQVRLTPGSCLGSRHAGKPSPSCGFPVVLKLMLGQEISIHARAPS